MALSILYHKGILNKHLNTCYFYEHSNIEERDEWIRLLNKLHWLKMQMKLTFFGITIWIFICKLSKYFFFISMLV